MKSGEKYWIDLSLENRLRLLEELDYWEGFAHYLWEYLPEQLQALIEEKASQ
jgi:hypothetical protein